MTQGPNAGDAIDWACDHASDPEKFLEAWRRDGATDYKDFLHWVEVQRQGAEEAKASYAGANGQQVEHMEIGGRIVEVDIEIAPIVQALNTGGVPTVSSCSGHGYRPATIILQDGRWLHISMNRSEAKKIEALFPLDINGNLPDPGSEAPAPLRQVVRSFKERRENDG